MEVTINNHDDVLKIYKTLDKQTYILLPLQIENQYALVKTPEFFDIDYKTFSFRLDVSDIYSKIWQKKSGSKQVQFDTYESNYSAKKWLYICSDDKIIMLQDVGISKSHNCKPTGTITYANVDFHEYFHFLYSDFNKFDAVTKNVFVKEVKFCFTNEVMSNLDDVSVNLYDDKKYFFKINISNNRIKNVQIILSQINNTTIQKIDNNFLYMQNVISHLEASLIFMSENFSISNIHEYITNDGYSITHMRKQPDTKKNNKFQEISLNDQHIKFLTNIFQYTFKRVNTLTYGFEQVRPQPITYIERKIVDYTFLLEGISTLTKKKLLSSFSAYKNISLDKQKYFSIKTPNKPHDTTLHQIGKLVYYLSNDADKTYTVQNTIEKCYTMRNAIAHHNPFYYEIPALIELDNMIPTLHMLCIIALLMPTDENKDQIIQLSKQILEEKTPIYTVYKD